jgi:SPP1 gp7 family putative phage head morphogenesis protein
LRDVTFEVEWVTAGDEQVCELCESLEGQVMHIDDAQNLLPRHPRCRCVVIPVRN